LTDRNAADPSKAISTGLLIATQPLGLAAAFDASEKPSGAGAEAKQ
jgi:hypothetical protein